MACVKGRRIRVWVAVTFYQEIYMFFFGYTILDSKVSIWVVQLSINFTQKKWGYCLIKRNLWVEYCLISGAHFLDAPTGILARKVLWIWHWIRKKAMVIRNARSLTNSLLNTSLTLCLADHTLKSMWKNFLLSRWYVWYKRPFFSFCCNWMEQNWQKILKWGSFYIF